MLRTRRGAGPGHFEFDSLCWELRRDPPQGRRRRGLGPICEPMALDRFSDNEVPGSGRRPHDKLISVYDRLSLAEQQALLAALEALDAADEPEPTSPSRRAIELGCNVS